jgi:hypothetical protein
VLTSGLFFFLFSLFSSLFRVFGARKIENDFLSFAESESVFREEAERDDDV